MNSNRFLEDEAHRNHANLSAARTKLAAALAGNPHADYDAAAAIAFAEEADAFAMMVFRLKYGRPASTDRVDRELYDDVLERLTQIVRGRAKRDRWKGLRSNNVVGFSDTILRWWVHAPDGNKRDPAALHAHCHDRRQIDRMEWVVVVLDGAAARAAENFMAKLAHEIGQAGL